MGLLIVAVSFLRTPKPHRGETVEKWHDGENSNVFLVAITALVASAGHFINFVQGGGETLSTVMSLVMFTVPGVVIGGQIGPLVAVRVSQRSMERGLAVLFILVAALMIGEIVL